MSESWYHTQRSDRFALDRGAQEDGAVHDTLSHDEKDTFVVTDDTNPFYADLAADAQEAVSADAQATDRSRLYDLQY